MFYLVKAPWLLQQYYWECLWKVRTDEKKLYLTFDDGPTPEPTDFVLDQLRQFDAQATFFCTGEQVEKHPEILQRLMDAGHTIGNHSYAHLNGWKTDNETYLDDIRKAQQFIDSRWFRPPYGRISKFQLYNLINGRGFKMKPVMWHVLSADFDTKVSPQQCYLNVIKNATKGSLIVFHDSDKAFPNLQQALPRVLQYYTDQGYQFARLEETDFKQNGPG